MAKLKKKTKWYFKVIKTVTRIKYKRPEFIFLGEKVTNGAIILSNHEGATVPMSLEIYADFPIRFWGANEMNSGLKSTYKYQTEVYYHQKKHWNLFWARCFCLLASPLTNLFYKGLNLISTYKDTRFFITIKESLQAIDQGNNIVIFPEDSTEGYKEQLSSFYSGFAILAEQLYKKCKDTDIFVCYYKKKTNQFIFDKPIKYSVLKENFGDREKIAKVLVEKCNALFYLDLDQVKKQLATTKD